MRIKEFLKPTILKMALLFVLIIISTFFSSQQHICNPTSYGFPLKFFQFSACVSIDPCIETTEPGPHIVCESLGFNSPEGIPAFIINLVFWYLISCVLVTLYNKKRFGA